MSEFRKILFKRKVLFDLCDDSNRVKLDFNRFNRSSLTNHKVLDPHGIYIDKLKNIDFIKIKRIFYSVTGIPCGL